MLKILLIINLALLVSGKPGNPWDPFPDPDQFPDSGHFPDPDHFPDDHKDDHRCGGLSIGGVIAVFVTIAIIVVLAGCFCKLEICNHLRVESICDICNL